MSRRLLIVSPHFPPVNAPDMQRARQALPYLADCGWEAEVLAVDAQDVAAPMDPLLARSIPSHVPVHRVRAPRSAVDRLLRRTSLGGRARPVLARAGSQLLRARRFDLVFFTTTQFSVLRAGASWQREHGVPYVVDWQDPWVTDYYDRPGSPPPPGGWRYRLAAREARRYERSCLEAAAGIVSVNGAYLAQLNTRYPALAHTPAAVIPFGFEPADFALAREPGIAPAFARRPGTRHLVFVGAAGGIMRPALELLFAGLRHWRDSRGGSRPDLHLHFVGTSYAPAEHARPSVLPLARAAGVAELVEETPARVGYLAALRTLLASDAILLLGSDDEAYSPSKLATVAFAGRPVLALVPAGGALDRALAEIGGATVAHFRPQPDVETVVEFLRAFPPVAAAAADRFTHLGAAARTRELAAFLDRALGAAAQP